MSRAMRSMRRRTLGSCSLGCCMTNAWLKKKIHKESDSGPCYDFFFFILMNTTVHGPKCDDHSAKAIVLFWSSLQCPQNSHPQIPAHSYLSSCYLKSTEPKYSFFPAWFREGTLSGVWYVWGSFLNISILRNFFLLNKVADNSETSGKQFKIYVE